MFTVPLWPLWKISFQKFFSRVLLLEFDNFWSQWTWKTSKRPKNWKGKQRSPRSFGRAESPSAKIDGYSLSLGSFGRSNNLILVLCTFKVVEAKKGHALNWKGYISQKQIKVIETALLTFIHIPYTAQSVNLAMKRAD